MAVPSSVFGGKLGHCTPDSTARRIKGEKGARRSRDVNRGDLQTCAHAQKVPQGACGIVYTGRGYRGFSEGEWVTGTWFPVTVWCPGARSCARQQCGVYPEGCGVIPVCAGGSVDRAS